MTSTIKKYPKFSIQAVDVANVSITANGTKWVTVPYPSGHTPIAMVGWYTNGTSSVFPYSIGLGSGGSTNVALRNTVDATVNFTFTARFLCVD